MKPIVWLIAFSLTANALLAGYWLKSRHNAPASEVSGDASQLASTGEKKSSPANTTEIASSVTSGEQASVASSMASWKDIQSSDLKEFVRRLRAAGCPKETIQDIILAEVNSRFAARSRELWRDRSKIVEFWRVGNSIRRSEELKQSRERWRKDRELQKEKSALLVELLGVDPEKEQRLADGYDEPMDWQAQRVSFVPESKRDAVLKLLEQFDEKSQDMSERNRGLWDAQSLSEQRQLEAGKLAALAQVLTPQELREYELRQSQTASQLSYDLRDLSINRDQYEAIFDIYKKYGDTAYNYDNYGDSQKAMKMELAAALGTDMAKQYERSHDYNFQKLTRFAKKNELPADTADKVFDYKGTAEAGAKQLRDDKTMDPAQRQAALQQIRSETEATLKQTLGEKAYKSYLNNGGWWINSLAPPLPKPKK